MIHFRFVADGYVRWLLLIVVVLSSLTTLVSSFELANTVDENVYVKAGLDYLNTLSFEYNQEHPPISKWIGALIPWAFSLDHIGWFRLSHVLLFLGGGLFFLGSFKRSYGLATALIFSLLYFLDPNVKSMAALHINDFDVALFVALAAFFGFRFYQNESKDFQALFFAFFCFSLAITSKFSGLFYAPFLIFMAYLRIRSFQRVSESPRVFKFICLPLMAIALAFFISYLFQISEIHWYGKGIDAQRLHNRAETHPAFMNGVIGYKGFPSFYLMSLWAKMPLGHLLVWVGALILFIKDRSRNVAALLGLFLLPALFLLVHLSLLNVQTGLRYFLPGILLMHLWASFVWGDWFRRGQFVRPVWGVCLLALFLVPDMSTWWRHSYLSYFNFWIAKPTRSFADANVDWRQGLPARVLRKLPPHLLWSEFRPSNFKESPSVKVLIGARDLSGMVALRGPLMRAFEPIAVYGGYELHEITREDAFRLFFYPVKDSYDALAKVSVFSEYLEQCRGQKIEVLDELFRDTCPEAPVH